MNRRLDLRSSLQAVAIALCLTGSILTSCSSATSLPQDAREIAVAVLPERQLESVLFIDVRTPAEYARDRIGDSPLVPIGEIETGSGVEDIQTAISRYSSDSKPVTVILYCERGFRSARAQKALEAAGIRSISLAGGIQAWRRQTSRERDSEVLKTLRHVSLDGV
ncbi:MAG: rhodanese-like domain-containing protein [Cyanobacteria bacterium J06648_11]